MATPPQGSGLNVFLHRALLWEIKAKDEKIERLEAELKDLESRKADVREIEAKDEEIKRLKAELRDLESQKADEREIFERECKIKAIDEKIARLKAALKNLESQKAQSQQSLPCFPSGDQAHLAEGRTEMTPTRHESMSLSNLGLPMLNDEAPIETSPSSQAVEPPHTVTTVNDEADISHLRLGQELWVSKGNEAGAACSVRLDGTGKDYRLIVSRSGSADTQLELASYMPMGVPVPSGLAPNEQFRDCKKSICLRGRGLSISLEGEVHLTPASKAQFKIWHTGLRTASRRSYEARRRAQPPGPHTRLADPRTLLPMLHVQQPLTASTSLNSSSPASIPVRASLDPSHTRLLLEAASGLGLSNIPNGLVLRKMFVSRHKGRTVSVVPKPPADVSNRPVYLTASSGNQADNWYLALKQLSVGAWH